MAVHFRSYCLIGSLLGCLQATALAAEVCVISPRLSVTAKGQAQGVVALARPTLLVRERLEAIWIERNGRLEWQQQWPKGLAFEGPLRWPLKPLGAGEVVRLLLRPEGAMPGDVAIFQLRGAPGRERARAQLLVARLGADPAAWLVAIDQKLLQGEVPLAWALLFATEAPSSAALNALRREVFARGCAD